MKELYLIPVKSGQISDNVFQNLRDWAADQPDDTYVSEYPRKMEREKTTLQNRAYWGRCDWFVKHHLHGEYTKRGYHAIFMQMCGFGEYVKNMIGDGFVFVPDSFTEIKISQISPLLEAQEGYNFDRTEGQAYLPSVEEWKEGKRI